MLDQEVAWLSAWQLRQLMLERQLSPAEVTRQCLERIERLDNTLHCFITVDHDGAMAQARAAEGAFGRGETAGALLGIPLSLKDHFWTRGLRTTGGSLLYRDHVPTEDSVYAARLRAAGAVLVGKTSTPEFEMFARTLNPLVPECVNPWDRTRIAGGSSGGAAASVAAGITPLAVGSDSGGSTRIPAAFCGVHGVVPGHGRVPRHGGFGRTLFYSGVGPIARDVRDAAILFQILADPDPRDPTCVTVRPPDYLTSLEQGVKGLRLGWWVGDGSLGELDAGVLESVRQAAARFESLGARVEECALGRSLDGLLEAFWTINNADHYAFLGQPLFEDPVRRGQLTPYVRARFVQGRAVTGAEYARALLTRFEVMAAFEALFAQYDLLLSPTVGIVAPPVSGQSDVTVPNAVVAYTFVVNFAGLAAATVPCAWAGGLPVGLQLIGRTNDEATVLRACWAFEAAWPWSARRPPEADQSTGARAAGLPADAAPPGVPGRTLDVPRAPRH